MAVTFTSLSTPLASTANQSTAYLGTAGTCAGADTLIAFVSVSGNTTAGTFTGGGLTWTNLSTQTKNAGVDVCAVYWAYSASAISITPSYLPASAATGCIISVIRVAGSTGDGTISGVRQTLPLPSSTGATANPTITFPALTLTTSGVLLFAANGTNSATQFTAPTGFTELIETSYNTPANGVEAASISGGATANNYTWTNANTTSWRTFGLEFDAAVATSFDPFGTLGFFGM